MENYYYLIKLLFSEGYAVMRFLTSLMCAMNLGGIWLWIIIEL